MNDPHRHTAIALGFSQLLAWGSSYYLLATLATPMAQAFALPNVAVYAMFSAALVAAAVLGPFAGRRIDARGGRQVLMVSNGLFALAHTVLALAPHPAVLALGWLLLGVAMPFGLYDAAFATLVRLHGPDARRRIVTVTLIAGFASTLSFPLTAWVEHHAGWRAACLLWAGLHLTVGLGIHARGLARPAPVPVAAPPVRGDADAVPSTAVAPPSRARLWLLAAVFAASGFTFAALAAHLPRLLQAAGCTPAAAILAASLVGASQVAARVLEVGVFSRWHPVVSARISLALHPLGAVLLAVFGAPLALLFTVLHGAGVGLMTIVKGTLPLALFGPAGFGHRAGVLEAPSRLMQAIAPVAYGLALDAWGAKVLWITAALMFFSFLAVVRLRSRAV